MFRRRARRLLRRAKAVFIFVATSSSLRRQRPPRRRDLGLILMLARPWSCRGGRRTAAPLPRHKPPNLKIVGEEQRQEVGQRAVALDDLRRLRLLLLEPAEPRVVVASPSRRAARRGGNSTARRDFLLRSGGLGPSMPFATSLFEHGTSSGPVLSLAAMLPAGVRAASVLMCLLS